MKELKVALPVRHPLVNRLKTILNWFRFHHSLQRADILEKLQFQRFLLHKGIDATAHVVEAEVKCIMFNNLHEVNLFLGILLPGHSTITFVRTIAIVRNKQLPQPGDKLHIRIIPDDPSAILIL